MLIIPILTPLMIHHLGAQQDQLPLLFLSGGIAGYLATKITGVLTSRFSAPILATVSTLLFVLSLLVPAIGYHNAVLFITLFLGSSYSRLVLSSSVTIQYPADEQRASFSSLQAAIMSLITTLAFFLSSLLLPDHGITTQNLDRLLIVCALAAIGFPLMVMALQKNWLNVFTNPTTLLLISIAFAVGTFRNCGFNYEVTRRNGNVPLD